MTVSARANLRSLPLMFAALGIAVPSSTSCFLLADVAATVLAAGLWLKFISR